MTSSLINQNSQEPNPYGWDYGEQKLKEFIEEEKRKKEERKKNKIKTKPIRFISILIARIVNFPSGINGKVK